MLFSRIIDILEEHEFLTAVSLIMAFYVAPIFARAIFAVLGGIIAFIVKTLFNDALENKIRSLVSNLLGGLLNNDKVEVRDVPHLDTDYLCIYRLYIPVTEHLTVEIPTVRIRVRFWRLLRKTFWLYLRNLDNRLAFNGYFKLLCSDELKEILLQNASINWSCRQHKQAEECYKDTNFDISSLNIIEENLKHYTFHLLWERADLKISLPGEEFAVENLGGYINNEKGKYDMYLHGLFDGQIMSITNRDKGIRNFRMMIPAVNLTPLIWTVICDYVPALTVFHSAQGSSSMGRMVNIICKLRITNKVEVADMEWTFRDGRGEYTGTASKHTYALTAIEGTFHIKEMKEFTIGRLNLKINNHNVGLAGNLTFFNPIDKSVHRLKEEGNFSLAIDANNFSFINGLDISVLDRFIIDGEITITPTTVHICFHSDSEHAINAFKFRYRDLSIIIDKFFGHITFEAAACFSQDIGCYLVSATKYGSPGIYNRNLIHLQSFYYDLIDQVFSIQLRTKGIDFQSFSKDHQRHANAISIIDIHGDFSPTGTVKACINEQK